MATDTNHTDTSDKQKPAYEKLYQEHEERLNREKVVRKAIELVSKENAKRSKMSLKSH